MNPRFKIVRYAKLTGRPTDQSGLGDVVARVAKPIARAIDRMFKTHLADCQRCDERRRWLNDKFPIIQESPSSLESSDNPVDD